MKTRRLVRPARLGVAVAVVGLLAAFAVGQVSGVNTADRDPQRSTVISKAAAVDVVTNAVDLAFLGGAGAVARRATEATSVSEPSDGAMSRYYEVNGASFSARVDTHYGTILTLLIPDNLPTGTGAKSVSPGTAQQIAADYLKANGIPTNGLTPQVVSKNRGPGLDTYQVVWSKRVHGVLMPEERFVELDAATGAIFRLHDLRRTAADPREPVVSQKDAVSAAQVEIGATGSTLESADLAITVDADGSEHVVWTIELSEKADQPWNHAWLVQVDAYSGIATVIAIT